MLQTFGLEIVHQHRNGMNLVHFVLALWLLEELAELVWIVMVAQVVVLLEEQGLEAQASKQISMLTQEVGKLVQEPAHIIQLHQDLLMWLNIARKVHLLMELLAMLVVGKIIGGEVAPVEDGMGVSKDLAARAQVDLLLFLDTLDVMRSTKVHPHRQQPIIKAELIKNDMMTLITSQVLV